MNSAGILSALSGGLAMGFAALTCGGADLRPSPWHGDNAVVAAPGSVYGERGRDEWLSGSLTRLPARDNNFNVSFSFKPGEWSSLTLLSSRGDQALESAWQYRGSIPEFPGAAGTFQAVYAERTARRTYAPLATVTNLVAGPVWAVVVNPALDNYELPTNSPAVFERIRILPLDFTPRGWVSPGWITGKAMEAHPYFCGLPRALANLLAATSTTKGNAPAVFGLVLIPLEHAPEVAKPEFSIPHTPITDSPKESPYLSLLVAQAKAAKSANKFGVEARYARRREKHRLKQLDLKREGIVEPDLADSPYEWTLCHPGDLPTLPFRIHALVR